MVEEGGFRESFSTCFSENLSSPKSDKKIISTRNRNTFVSSPLLMFGTKRGTAQFCIDYRNSGQGERASSFPLPPATMNLKA